MFVGMDTRSPRQHRWVEHHRGRTLWLLWQRQTAHIVEIFSGWKLFDHVVAESALEARFRTSLHQVLLEPRHDIISSLEVGASWFSIWMFACNHVMDSPKQSRGAWHGFHRLMLASVAGTIYCEVCPKPHPTKLNQCFIHQ